MFEETIALIDTNDINEKTLAAAFGMIEIENKRVAFIVTNIKIFDILRCNMRSCLDLNTEPKLLNLGYRGMLWGAAIWIKDVENLMCVYKKEAKSLDNYFLN